jgi:NAD(P)-dependent dehydrogenase (short-subunit alcohol dehydrogenase family)
VFFGSYAAEGNLPGIGAYNIAKRALEYLARQLAQEAPQIVSLVFRPGATETRVQQQAREAEGGAAKVLHREFRGYLQRGVLDTPEKAARRLLKYLLNDPRRHHGRVVT